jgi:hypothetical protein
MRGRRAPSCGAVLVQVKSGCAQVRPKEMGPGIAARPHCAERRICRCSQPGHQTRRLKDPSSILAHQLRRRFPSRRSKDPVRCSVRLPREPRPPIPLRICPKASATLMFRGPSWTGPLPRGLSPWGGNRPRQRKHQHFRRLLPTGPEIRSLRHRPEGQFSFEPHSIACRRRSVLPSLAASSCRCRPSVEAGTSVPITN